MHKRILVPIDDSAHAQAVLPSVQSPSLDSWINDAWKAEPQTYLTRVEYEGKSISFLIGESSTAQAILTAADAMKVNRIRTTICSEEM